MLLMFFKSIDIERKLRAKRKFPSIKIAFCIIHWLSPYLLLSCLFSQSQQKTKKGQAWPGIHKAFCDNLTIIFKIKVHLL
jgi:hypothetical protein